MTIEFPAPPAPVIEASPCEDVSRYERLFTTHYLPVLRVCLRRLQDQSDAEDAVQEVFRRAVQQGADLEGDPLPWLVTVAKHVCLDELRRRRTGRAALERTAALTAGTEAVDAQVDRNPERVVLGRMFVRDMLGRLTPAERRVVAARLFSGETGVETAQSLGVSSSTTRVLLARARQKLRTYLEEGQAVLGGAALYATRSMYGLRRRLLQPSSLHDRAAALFPAALILTVIITPGMSSSRIGHDESGVTAQAPDASLHDGIDLALALGLGRTGHLVGDGGSQVGAASQGASGPTSGDNGVHHVPVLPQFAAPDPNAVDVTDVEPSPNYSKDHTVYLIGNLPNCLGAPCTQLFKSSDGGATWGYVAGSGLTSGGQLILPADAYAHNRFYAFTNSGLEVTKDGGATFTPIMPISMATGYASAAPAWTGLDVMVSNAATLWKIGGSLTPLPLTTVGVDRIARGAALVLPSATGALDMLQPVASASGLTGNTVEVMHCSTGGCGGSVPLPFAESASLIASPTVATDHTVFAWNAGTPILSVSRDGGASFTSVASDTVGRIIRMTAVSGPSGPRLVGALYPQHGIAEIAYSDDLGRTWQHARIDPALRLGGVQYVAGLGQGTMIASALQIGQGAYYRFTCSEDAGETWRACTPQAGG